MINDKQNPAKRGDLRIKKLEVRSDIFCSRFDAFCSGFDAYDGHVSKEEPVNDTCFQFLKSMINTMVNPISYKDKNGVYLGVNERFAKQVFGLPEREIVGYTLPEVCIKFVTKFPERAVIDEKCFIDICRGWDRMDRILLDSGGSESYEQEVMLADGTKGIFVVNRSTFKDEDGEVLGLVTVLQDITELRTSEKALEENEERYRIVTEQTGQLVYDNNIETNKLSLAGAVEEILGYRLEEIINFSLDDWIRHIHPEERDYVFDKFMKARRTGGRDSLEYRLRKKDGTYISVEDTGTYLLKEDKTPYRVLGTVKDITERKLAHEMLELSEEKYRSFIQNFKGIAFQLDENFVPEFVHGAIKEITGYSEEDFMLTSIWWMDIVHPEDRPAVLNEVMITKNSLSAHHTEFEYRIKHKNGSIKWVNELFQKVRGKGGISDKYQGAVYDITEKKEAEEALSEMKEARIKEIHHRIKNNLQVISSLLDLQTDKFQDEMAREAFRESQNRIISMALIHEALYQERNTETLNFAAYIQKLGQNLFHTYRLDHPGVSLQTDLQDNIFVDVDTAVPLGIIINELVSNSLKHAFPGQKKGRIRILLSQTNQLGNSLNETTYEGPEIESPEYGILSVIVSDNGVGIPDDVDIKNPGTLGLQLVSALVDQLDGELKLKTNHGTEFTVRITTR